MNHKIFVFFMLFAFLVFLGKSAIAQEAVCGNGIVEAGEQCDASTGNETCTTKGFDTGTLLCTNCAFDTSDCRDVFPPLPPEPEEQNNEIIILLVVVFIIAVLGSIYYIYSRSRKNRENVEPEVPVPDEKTAVD